jgi:hypothetical protein
LGLCRGIELTFVIKVDQDSTDMMIFPGKEIVLIAKNRALSSENRSKAHDSTPEEQF